MFNFLRASNDTKLHDPTVRWTARKSVESAEEKVGNDFDNLCAFSWIVSISERLSEWKSSRDAFIQALFIASRPA